VLQSRLKFPTQPGGMAMISVFPEIEEILVGRLGFSRFPTVAEGPGEFDAGGQANRSASRIPG
jgi:hypothetical protein